MDGSGDHFLSRLEPFLTGDARLLQEHFWQRQRELVEQQYTLAALGLNPEIQQRFAQSQLLSMRFLERSDMASSQGYHRTEPTVYLSHPPVVVPFSTPNWNELLADAAAHRTGRPLVQGGPYQADFPYQKSPTRQQQANNLPLTTTPHQEPPPVQQKRQGPPSKQSPIDLAKKETKPSTQTNPPSKKPRIVTRRVIKKAKPSTVKQSKTYGCADVRGMRWQNCLNSLKEYKAQHGHCLVPSGYKHDSVLARWVVAQRRVHKEGKLDPERFRQLDALGFVWTIPTPERPWQTYLNELKEYKTAHGNCLVPRGYLANPCLGMWVNRQRKLVKKKGPLTAQTQARIAELNALGFVWSVKEAAWAEQADALRRFRSIHGHCRVPADRTWKKLAVWAAEQRLHYRAFHQLDGGSKKCSGITQKQIDILDQLGFCWDNETA